MSTRSATLAVALACLVLGSPVTPAVAAPEGEMTWAVHVSLAPTWLDPAETPGLATPFMILYAVHDALVKPMPGNAMTPSLAESWKASPDGLTYTFALREGVKFHNGEPVTAADVKFSFERYRGTASKLFKERVAGVDVVDAQTVRFRLKQPWPDFMTFYATPATGLRGSCRRSTSSRSVTRASRRRPSAPAPIASCRSSPASSWSSRRTSSTGARRRRSRSSSSARCPTTPRAWPCSSAARRTSSTRSAACSARRYAGRRD